MTANTATTRQWIRQCKLLIGTGSGEWLDVSEMHIKFETTQALSSAPGKALIRIYNLSDGTSKKVQEEGAPVQLMAGYGGNVGLIFSGSCAQIRRGRESGTDKYLELTCQDGDLAMQYATINRSLSAGWTQRDALGAAHDSLKAHGVDPGYTGGLFEHKMPRGKAIFGAARDHLDDWGRSVGMDWAIRDGQLNCIPATETAPGAAFELTPKTGLIGMPAQTVDGITLRSLLNPMLRAGQQVHLSHNLIVDGKQDPTYTAPPIFYAPTDLDGFYKIYNSRVVGDTRGNDWYSDCVCVAMDKNTAPISGLFVNTVANKGY